MTATIRNAPLRILALSLLIAVVAAAGCTSSSAPPEVAQTKPGAEKEKAPPVKPADEGETTAHLKTEKAPPAQIPVDDTKTKTGAASTEPKTETPKTPEKTPDEQPKSESPTQGDLEPQTGRSPYPLRREVKDFPTDREWLNTGRPLKLRECKGKFVVLDFWTYCCINCMHILPELKKLEHAYPNNVVVIGVHSAKFDTEQDTKNIRDAILRYEIEHPVVNDFDHKIWDDFGISSWPSLRVIDPEGYMVGGQSGEVKFEDLEAFIQMGLPYYREKGLLNEQPLKLTSEAAAHKAGPLKFPSKVHADAKSQRLFITDSGHNRIVVASLEGKLLETIGSGAQGRADGDFAAASFNRPQGTFLHNDTLYVADTENHMLRKVDLKAKKVTTIAGIGEQARVLWPGLDKVERLADVPERWVGKPLETALNSPWALWVQGENLYIAMAGPHEIWKMPLDEREIGPYAGNGREDIVDGPLLPKTPYEPGFSSFAQPSGLAGDNDWLYVADSEGSSIRAVPFNPEKEVRTVIGTADLPGGRLFTFGDVDGKPGTGRLQHPLDVAFRDGKLYVADTYNNKVRVVDASTGELSTLAGNGKPGRDDSPAAFDEPEGLAVAGDKLFVADTNNHAIRVIDLGSGNKVSTLAIEGLAPPKVVPQVAAAKVPKFDDADQEKLDTLVVQPKDGHVKLQVSLALPPGWKINPLGPGGYAVLRTGEKGVVASDSLGKFVKLSKPEAEFTITLPVSGTGTDELKVGVNYYYCEDKENGLCKEGSVLFTLPLKVDASGAEIGKLSHTVK